eukprot:CAMPEP_0119125952 /NCGR_PEP_ID=MMETSP1310-20130426/5052_1 /TAXON_ID=464262 /ORGANISM="Genus nov. species nov., Strain RCC2339" /LENGTH=357 /DNA_ID=CAMNT_0007116073 /DNA_START=481 /DNA_END=1554 /DNA_ORIENTATION=-
MNLFGQVSACLMAVVWLGLLYAFRDGWMGYLVAGLVTSLLAGLPRVGSVYGLQERDTVVLDIDASSTDDERATPLRREHQTSLSYTSFPFFHYLYRISRAFFFTDYALILILIFLCNFALTLHQSTIIFILQSAFTEDNSEYWVVFAEEGVGMLTLPLWYIVMRKVGKKKSFFMTALLLCATLCGAAFVPPTMGGAMLAMVCMIGTSNATVMILQAMLPDVIQAYEIFSGRRDEGMLYSVSMFFTKVGGACGASVASYSLGVSGYTTDSDSQVQTVDITLRAMCFGVPAILLGVGAIVNSFISDYKEGQSFDWLRHSSQTSESDADSRPEEDPLYNTFHVPYNAFRPLVDCPITYSG